MRTSREIRQAFLDFFKSKGHDIVPSAPIVNKNDPTLMFTNAGMNQFKDFFLGNKIPENPRIADTQKCMRVSGKHNDLEDVGYDGTHHTMFEMLGNWSIGDYFKEEAIAWSWELLHDVFKIPKDRLYATVFGGDASENLERDDEALNIWLKYLPKDHILYGNKKDNFWEMGDTGPCGPCSEIHVDLRSDEERAKTPGNELVNQDHPQVIEIWNNVFIQFNRKADSSLESLPAKHVDTGMGFERLCMVLQGKNYTYDTDVFTPIIRQIEKASGKTYTGSYERDAKTDVAMRVVADHIRAVAFTIADGQLPSSGGAGYVVRRILRRAVRYYYSFLEIKEPFLHTLIPLLVEIFDGVFPELTAQQSQLMKIIEGEEIAFLHTLENGLRRIETIEPVNGLIKGEDAFELYDTFGFPIDLTRLIAQERGLKVDEVGFNEALIAQKERSRADAAKEVGDWETVRSGAEVEFVGYDLLVVEDAQVLKYRTVKVKKDNQYQIVLNRTPFYGESGGQTGDSGWLFFGEEKIKVIDTQKENDLIIHILEKLPKNISAPVRAEVDAERRHAIENNHTATHLMHAALHHVLGEHALQKGQDVDDQRLRFDFSHFQKVTDEELERIEDVVNEKIRENIKIEEARDIPIDVAKEAGAMMLFGEKYGNLVRMITFDKNFSRELCGGTHVPATGKIGLFKIVSEGAVAAGIRRIEAITAEAAEQYIKEELKELGEIRELLKNPKNTAKNVASIIEENKALKKEIEKLMLAQANALKSELKSRFEAVNGFNFLATRVDLGDANTIKNLVYQLEKEVDDAVIVLGAELDGKNKLFVRISPSLVTEKGLHAAILMNELGKGGGQSDFASGSTDDLNQSIKTARSVLEKDIWKVIKSLLSSEQNKVEKVTSARANNDFSKVDFSPLIKEMEEKKFVFYYPENDTLELNPKYKR